MNVPHNKQVLLNKISSVRINQAKHTGTPAEIKEAERKFKGLEYAECEFVSIKPNPKVPNSYIADIKVAGRGYELTNQRWNQGKLEVVSGIFARTVANQEQLDKIVKPGLYVNSETSELVVVLREDDEFEEVFTHLGYYYEEAEYTKTESGVSIDSVIAKGDVRLTFVKEGEDGGCIITNDNLKLTTAIETLYVGSKGEVVATLLDDDKRPVKDAEISIGHLGHDATLNVDMAVTDAQGKAVFELTGVKEGSVFLQAFHGLEQDSNRLKITIARLLYTSKDLAVTGEKVREDIVATATVINSLDQIVSALPVTFGLGLKSSEDAKVVETLTNDEGIATANFGPQEAGVYVVSLTGADFSAPVNVEFNVEDLPVVYAFSDETVKDRTVSAKLSDANGSVIGKGVDVGVIVDGAAPIETTTDKNAKVSHVVPVLPESLEEQNTKVQFVKDDVLSQEMVVSQPAYVPDYTLGMPLVLSKPPYEINKDIEIQLGLTEAKNLFLNNVALGITNTTGDVKGSTLSDVNGEGKVKVKPLAVGELILSPYLADGKADETKSIKLDIADNYKPAYSINYPIVVDPEQSYYADAVKTIELKISEPRDYNLEGVPVQLIVQNPAGSVKDTYDAVTDAEGKAYVDAAFKYSNETVLIPVVNGKPDETKKVVIDVLSTNALSHFEDVVLEEREHYFLNDNVGLTALFLSKSGQPMNGTGCSLTLLKDGKVIHTKDIGTPLGEIKQNVILSELGDCVVRLHKVWDESLKGYETVPYDVPVTVLDKTANMTITITPEADATVRQHEPAKFNIKALCIGGQPSENVPMTVTLGSVSQQAMTGGEQGTDVIITPTESGELTLKVTIGVSSETLAVNVEGKPFNVETAKFVNLMATPNESLEIDEIRVSGVLVDADGVYPQDGTTVTIRHHEQELQVPTENGIFLATIYATGDGNEGESEEIIEVLFGENLSDVLTIKVDDSTRHPKVASFAFDKETFESNEKPAFRLTVTDQNDAGIVRAPVEITRKHKTLDLPVIKQDFITDEYGVVDSELDSPSGDWVCTAKVKNLSGEQTPLTASFRNLGELAVIAKNLVISSEPKVGYNLGFDYTLVNQFDQPIANRISHAQPFFGELIYGNNIKMTSNDKGVNNNTVITLNYPGDFIYHVVTETGHVTDFPFTVTGNKPLADKIGTSNLSGIDDDHTRIRGAVSDKDGKRLFLEKTTLTINNPAGGEPLYTGEMLTDYNGVVDFEVPKSVLVKGWLGYRIVAENGVSATSSFEFK